MKTVYATLRNLRIAPRKTRFVADLIRGLSVPEAEAQLMFQSRRPAGPILKLLRSAKANAKHNFQLDPNTLAVKEIRVDGGQTAKRWTPRARGSMARIEKKTSHITLMLAPGKGIAKPARFIVPEPVKKTREEQEGKRRAPKKAPKMSKKEEGAKTGSEKAPEEKKRIFRRKSV